MLTDPAARLATLEDDALLALHKRLDDSSTAHDPVAVEAHHLVSVELLKRGLEHGHDGDAWSDAVVLVDEAVVKSVDEIGLPEGMGQALEAPLQAGGTVQVMLTVDGYVLKAEPSVSDVHVDAVVDAYPLKRRRKRKAGVEVEVEKADGYSVPAEVQSAARRALAWIADGRAGDGFTSVGRNRAKQLADGGTVGRDTLVKMRAYFARHAVDKKAEAWGDAKEPTPGMVAWYAWGGDPGRAWANRVLGAVEKAYEPEEALTGKQRALYEAYEMIADRFGEFTPEEAHYMGPDDNPFQADGMNCANCVSYDGGGGCEILTARVEPMALCKLWVIPDDLMAVDEEELLQTMDEDDLAGFAAYGMDDDDVEKRGNPEPLRDYWRGGGKGKINWGGGGDFTACVAAVSKYMTSEEAKGYCAIRHREVTGMWPGDKRNRAQKAYDPMVAAATFTLPDGATYTYTAPATYWNQPVEKHGSHDQSSHAPRKGGGTPSLVADQAPNSSRSPQAAAEATALRKRAEALEPEITGKVTSMVTERGGTMEGLEQRLKTTDSLARKIDADAEAEYGGDRAAAAANISDAVRYTAVIGDAQYTDGARAIVRDLEQDGYQVRAKNFWQKGDDYQGINIKATKDGVTVELQLHTPTSLDIKEGRSTKGDPIRSLHDSYEVMRTSGSKRERWKAWTGMVRLASQIPQPQNYEALLSIGTLTLKTFE